jgi:GTP-binding protein HflX
LDDKTKVEIEAEMKENLKFEFEQDNVMISAITRENLNELREKLTTLVKEQYATRYPYQAKRW